MSDNGGVIKEFLVKLGYQIDGSTEKKFRDGIKQATEVVSKLGIVAPLTATAVVAAITKMADNLDALYFASQRTRSSADNIRALDFAASQMGSSAESAQGALESIAKFMAVNPGGESLIRSWGIQTRETNGELRDTTKIMTDLGGLFRRLGTPQAYRRAEVLGIDYKTMLALMNGLDGFEDRYKQILAKYGLDTQKAAEQSHQFMLRIRDLRANAEVLGAVIGTRLIGVFDELEYRWDSLDDSTKKNIESFGKWAAALLAGGAIIAGGPVVWIGALAAAILGLWDDYQVWREGGKSLIDWGKWKPEIDLASAGIELIKDGFHNLISFYEASWPHIVQGWKDFTDVVKDAYNWVMKVVRAVEDSPAFKWVMEHTQGVRQTIANDFNAAKQWVSDHLPASAPGSDKDLRDAQHALDQIWNQLTGKPYDHGVPDGQAPASGDTVGIRNNNPGNLRTGPGGSFGTYGTPQQGLEALRDQLSLYFNGQSRAAGYQHLDTLRDIISTYAPKSENNTSAYIADVAKQMGIDADTRINLNDPSTMEALMRGIIQHENGYNPYKAEILDQVAGVSNTQNAGNRSLSQTTNINVYGATDPHQTASAVGNEQSRVNERLTRDYYFSPAI